MDIKFYLTHLSCDLGIQKLVCRVIKKIVQHVHFSIFSCQLILKTLLLYELILRPNDIIEELKWEMSGEVRESCCWCMPRLHYQIPKEDAVSGRTWPDFTPVMAIAS